MPAGAGYPIPFDKSSPLVMTHGCIHPGSVILGDDGRLWLVTWNSGGFYPTWFEHIVMKTYADIQEERTGRWDIVWQYLMAFVCGADFKAVDWFEDVAWIMNYH